MYLREHSATGSCAGADSKAQRSHVQSWPGLPFDSTFTVQRGHHFPSTLWIHKPPAQPQSLLLLKERQSFTPPSSCSCKAEVRGSAVSLDSQKQGCWGGQGSRHLLICTTIIHLPHHAAPTIWDFLLWSHSCAQASQALSYAPLSVCSAFLLVPGIQHTLLDFKTIPRRILQVQLSEAPLLIIPLLRGPAAQGCW